MKVVWGLSTFNSMSKLNYWNNVAVKKIILSNGEHQNMSTLAACNSSRKFNTGQAVLQLKWAFNNQIRRYHASSTQWGAHEELSNDLVGRAPRSVISVLVLIQYMKVNTDSWGMTVKSQVFAL